MITWDALKIALSLFKSKLVYVNDDCLLHQSSSCFVFVDLQ